MKLRSTFTYLGVLFLLLFFFLHWSFIEDSPNASNTFAQSNAYSISLGYVQNNLNFFKPENQTDRALLSEFQGKLDPHYSQALTPSPAIHSYIPAVFMKLFQTNSPWIYRMYTLIWGFVGLYFLFLISLRASNHVGKSLFLVLFVGTLPLFAFYQSNFLPSVPALASAFIGIYHFMNYWNSHQKTALFKGIFWLLFACASSFSYGFVLLALVFATATAQFQNGTLSKKIFWPIVAGTAGIALCLFYLQFFHLPSSSNLFVELNQGPETPDALLSNNSLVWNHLYFTKLHKYIFLVLAGYFLVNYFQNRYVPSPKTQKIRLFVLVLGGVVLLQLIGFEKHLLEHDYFALDLLLLPFALIFMLLLTHLQWPKKYTFRTWYWAIPLLISFILIGEGNYGQVLRRRDAERTAQQTQSHNYLGSDLLLNELKIPQNAPIVIISGPKILAPQIPLIEMHHRGIVLPATPTVLKNLLHSKADYFVFETIWLPAINTMLPEFQWKTDLVGSNGTISVYTRSNRMPPLQIDLGNYLKEKSKESGRPAYPIQVAAENPFPATYTFEDLKLFNRPRKLVFSALLYAENKPTGDWVLSLKNGDQHVEYISVGIGAFPFQANTWNAIAFELQIPAVTQPISEAGFYVWNKDNQQFQLDQVKFVVY